MTVPVGPWGWTYDGSSDYSIGPAADPQDRRVAHVYSRNPDTAHAICNLIAAAPQLFYVLKLILGSTEGIYKFDRDAAEAAIAKAEGRS
jgi:hypothetical protein